MAISGLVYSRNQFRFGIAQQTTWGTAVALDTAFHELHVLEPPMIDFGGIVRDETKRADGKLLLSHTDVYVTEAGSDLSVKVIGLVERDTADILLYGVMQDIESEAGVGPYLKIMNWDRNTTGRTASGIPNKFFTLEFYDPAADESKQLKDCVIKTLKLTSDPAAHGGRLAFEAEFWCGAIGTYTGITAGIASWDAAGTDYYAHQVLETKQVAGADVVLGKWDLTFENNCTRVGYDSSGNAQGVMFPDFRITGSVNVKYDANTKDALANYLTSPMGGGAELAVLLRYGGASAEKELTFTLNAIYSGPPAHELGGAGGVFVNLPFVGVDDGTNEAIEVRVSTVTDHGWT